MTKYLLANQVGFLPLNVVQPERADNFGNPINELAFPFLGGWKGNEPYAGVPLDRDWRKDSAKLCNEALQSMLKELHEMKEVNWRVKETIPESTTLAHGTESQEGKVEWETISGAIAYEKVVALLKAHPFKPTHRAYSTNRRSYQILVAAARFVDSGGKFEDFKIPYVEKTFANGQEEKLERWAENTDKHYAKAYSVAGFAEIISQGIDDFRWNEAKAMFHLKLKRGQAQQAYAWAILAREYPKANILPRLRMNPGDKVETPEGKRYPYVVNGYIPSGISATDLRGILGLSDASEGKNLPPNVLKAYADAGVNPEKVGKRWANAPSNVLEKLFQNYLAGIQKAPRSVTKDGVNAIATKFPADNPLNGFLKQVAEGNEEGIEATLPKVKAAFEELETLRAKVVELTTERDTFAQRVDELTQRVNELEKQAKPAPRKGSNVKA